MTAGRRIPLNPCDCCILAQHRRLAVETISGNVAFMVIDVDAHLNRGDIVSALAATMRAHPITMASLRTAPLRIRPFWRLPADPPIAARQAADAAYSYDDLSGKRDWQTRYQQLFEQRYAAAWNLRRGPPVRLEQYDLPDGRSRFCLRWPHFLMDAEGAQHFLADLSHHDNGASRAVASDETGDRRPPIDVLAGRSLWQRIRLVCRGLTAQRSSASQGGQPLAPAMRGHPQTYRALSKHWSGSQVERIRDNARRQAPPGPALHARYLAASVLGAMDRLHHENAADTSGYVITLPMSIKSGSEPNSAGTIRPVAGNYLVTPMIRVTHDEAIDKRASAAAILSQMESFRENKEDLAQWTLLWAASLVHAWLYPVLFRVPIGLPELSSGFSYYSEIDNPIRSLCGARVTNVWGGGPTATPPALNPVFSRFENQLNLSMTWNEPAVSDRVARRYAELIEREILGE